jgi:hypothetical protein
MSPEAERSRHLRPTLMSPEAELSHHLGPNAHVTACSRPGSSGNERCGREGKM